MKKFAFLILLSFILTGCPGPGPVPVEMLDDCTLENTLLVGWLNNVMGPATDFIIVRTSEESASQTHSLKISKTFQDPESYAYWSQSINEKLPLNKKLTLSAKIKCANLNGRGVSIVIRCDNNYTQVQFATTELATTISGTTDWKQYSVSIDALNPVVDNIIVYLIYLNNTSGALYFDDIHLLYE